MSEDSAISSAPDDIHPQLEDGEEIVTYTAEPSNISVEKVRVSEVELISDEQDSTPPRNTESRNSSHSAHRILGTSSNTNLDMDDGAVKVTIKKTRLRENICLGVMIFMAIGIVLAPIILYYTGRGGFDNVFDDLSVLNCHEVVNASGDCIEYDSPVCGSLFGKLSIFNNSMIADDTLAAIMNITSENQTCAEAATDFFCGATYRSCDNGITFVPSKSNCQLLQDECRYEWSQLQSVSPDLTDCSAYNFSCPDQFDVFCGDICLPLCTEFSQNSEGVTILLTVVIGIVSNVGNVIGGIAVFVVAFFKGKNVMQFPQVLILYSTITVSITVIIIAVPYISSSVFCQHDDLFSAVAEPTAYCEIYGFVYQAGFLIFSGFWLLFIIHLFIKLVFPIRARNLDNHRHRRKIHVIEIVGIVLVGLFIPSVIVGTTKYNIGNFPPTQCSSNADVSFHTLILPTIIVMTTGVILILLSFMSIHRRKGIFKTQKSAGKSKLSFLQFSTPEVKLLIVFFYFTLVLLIYWCDFSVQLRSRNELFSAVNNYATCVRDGDKPECNQYLDDVRGASFPALNALALIMTSLVNLSNVVFVLQFRDVKETLRRMTRRFTAPKNLEPKATKL